jgi:flagellar hook-associated protein 2
MATSSSISGVINQTVSGRTYITGLSSGLNTTALIEAAVNQKLTKASRIDTQIGANSSKVAGYQFLKSYMQSLQTSLAVLKSTPTAPGSALTAKKASYTTSDGSVATNTVTATIGSNARDGVHTVRVQQLAKAMTITSEAQSSQSAALGFDGTFDIALEGRSSTTITLTTTMTLANLRDAINEQSSTTGVSADIVQVADGQFKLVLNGADTAKAISFSNVTGDDVLQQLGITDENGDFAHISQPAQQSITYLDGTEVRNDRNVLIDALTGITLNLINASPSTTITFTVGSNTDGIKNALNSFITSYNTLRNFVKQQQQVDASGTIGNNSVLFGDTILRNFTKDFGSAISGSFGDGLIDSLAALGIKLDSNNNLTVKDQDALNNALTNNLSAVQALFSTHYSSTDTNLALVQNSSNINSSFALNIQTDGSGHITSVSANGNANAFTVSGNRLIGKAGTAYAGLELEYNGLSSTTITVTLRQGLADRLHNLLNSYATDEGVIAKQIQSLQDIDLTLQAKSDEIKSQVEDYRQKLIDKYARMETKIQASQLLKQQILAILDGSTRHDS